MNFGKDNVDKVGSCFRTHSFTNIWWQKRLLQPPEYHYRWGTLGTCVPRLITTFGSRQILPECKYSPKCAIFPISSFQELSQPGPWPGGGLCHGFPISVVSILETDVVCSLSSAYIKVFCSSLSLCIMVHWENLWLDRPVCATALCHLQQVTNLSWSQSKSTRFSTFQLCRFSCTAVYLISICIIWFYHMNLNRKLLDN